MKRPRFNEQEDRAVIERERGLRLPGREHTPNAACERARRLRKQGVDVPYICPPYTPEEDAAILTRTVSFAMLARELGRPKASVVQRSKRLRQRLGLD